MTERIAARIEIGGPLPAEQMVELIEAIEIEKSCSVSSARSACWAAIRNAIRAAADRGEPLIVQESDVAHGIFQTLEELCREHGLTYHRASDGSDAGGALSSPLHPRPLVPIGEIGRPHQGLYLLPEDLGGMPHEQSVLEGTG